MNLAAGNSADGLPHANILGLVGRRNAVFRVAFSSIYDDAGFEPFVHNKNRIKSVVKTCRQIGWNIIIHTGVGRVCNQIDHAIGAIDGRWAEWTMGAEARNASATFDGFIPTSRSRYPGTSISDPSINFRADNANHMNIQYNQAGINKIAAAMLQIQMERAPAPPPPPPPPPCEPIPPALVCDVGG
jgi:hypothetical protein